MITATIRLRVSDRTRAEIVRLFRPLVEPIRVEAGCSGCALYTDLHDRRNLLWVEEWDSQEHLERHLRSSRYRQILAAIDMSSGKPEIRFDTVAETRGMRLIAESRDAGRSK